MDNKALYKIGYGLYVITSSDGVKDNGMICNTVTQVASDPLLISVSINKANFSHDIINKTGKMNVHAISEVAPFELFKRFGFVSGRDVDKFSHDLMVRTDNGLPLVTTYTNSVICLKVKEYVDLGSHGLFLCGVEDAKVFNNNETMSYSYYQKNVKPKVNKEAKKKGYVCKICGYVYEGDELPEDFICPICKHPASDFEKIN